MTMRKTTITALLAVALVIVTLGLSGCKPADEPQAPPQPTGPTITRTVKLMPPESGENQRIYGHTPDGTLVELQIDYRDGHSETMKHRPDGTVESKKVTYPHTGAIKSEITYEADGKTVKNEANYRGNGTLEQTRQRASDGTETLTRYRVDGKRLHSIEVTKPGGDKNTTFYREDGKTLWAESRKISSTETEVKYYGTSGTLEQIRLVRHNSYNGYQNGFEVTVLRPDGTAHFKQTWTGYSSSYYRNFDLKTVEEYEADGTTLKRKLTMQYDGRTVKEAVIYESGVKKSVRKFRYDGTLETEEFFDSAGASEKTENHEASEAIRENVDAALIDVPAYGDPLALKPTDFQ